MFPLSKRDRDQFLDQRAAADREDDVLLAAGHVGDRRAGGVGRQFDLRQHLAAGLVVDPQMRIEIVEVAIGDIEPPARSAAGRNIPSARRS